jgi:hypothetical protein
VTRRKQNFSMRCVLPRLQLLCPQGHTALLLIFSFTNSFDFRQLLTHDAFLCCCCYCCCCVNKYTKQYHVVPVLISLGKFYRSQLLFPPVPFICQEEQLPYLNSDCTFSKGPPPGSTSLSRKIGNKSLAYWPISLCLLLLLRNRGSRG